MVAVWLEYNLMKLRPYVVLNGEVKTIDKHPLQSLTPLYIALQLIAVLLAVIGTLIWGYGDLALSTP